LLSGADADDAASTMLLYRVGDRSVSAIAASSTAAELRLPTSPSVLISALRDAIARDARSATARPKDELMERLASCAATAPPLLLAEDSPANQLVATSILRKAGFRVDVVDNGLQAVAAAKRSDYALVLMDLAMPDMDGIEATSCIRALPGRRGQVPIVAMTANVFDEDRRRCFEAGMDGHLSKPVERRTLFEALLRWIRTPDAEAAPPAPPSESTATDPSGSAGDPNPSPDRGSSADSRSEKEASPIDEEVLSDLMQDLSEELMPDIVATFVGEAAGRVDAVVQAAGEGDCQRVAEESHALKGSSATFGARLLRDAAAALEKAGRAGDLHAIRTQVDGLQVEADRALSDLRNRFGP
jgi:two-component system sensor histidine kinase/response regulator